MNTYSKYTIEELEKMFDMEFDRIRKLRVIVEEPNKEIETRLDIMNNILLEVENKRKEKGEITTYERSK